MSFDPAVEPPIPLSKVPELAWLPLRPSGRRIHPVTLVRWARSGLRGVRLEVISFGASMATSEAALRRFFAALTAKDAAGAGPPIPPGPARSPRRPGRRGVRKSSAPRA